MIIHEIQTAWKIYYKNIGIIKISSSMQYNNMFNNTIQGRQSHTEIEYTNIIGSRQDKNTIFEEMGISKVPHGQSSPQTTRHYIIYRYSNANDVSDTPNLQEIWKGNKELVDKMELDYIHSKDKVTNEQDKFRNLIDMLDEQNERSSFHQHNTQ